MPQFEGLHIQHLALEDSSGILLNDSPSANIELNSGDVIAICGPSDSGKSAFLHLLAGSNVCVRKLKCYGKVAIVMDDGTNQQRCSSCWYRKVRLVPHNDMFISSLSCRENIENYSRLSNNAANVSHLLAGYQNVLVNNLEARSNIDACSKLKRLSILSAMTSEPAVLLIDEPLFLLEQHEMAETGKILQEYAQNQSSRRKWECQNCGICVNVLRRCVLVALNSTVLTIGADGYLDFVTKFLFLSKSKQIVYFGSLDDAVSSLGLSTVKDIVPFLEQSERDREHRAAVNKRLSSKGTSITTRSTSLVLTLLRRHIQQFKNVPKQFLRVIIERVIIFTLLAFIFQYPNSRSSLIGLFFFLPINQTSNVILFTSSESFTRNELSIIQKDRFNNLYRAWHIIAVKYAVMVVINILPSIAYLPVIFYVSAITNHGHFALFVLANILNIFCSCAVGLFIAAISKDLFIRNLWLFGFSTVFATFGGIHTAANHQLPWNIRWIQYLSPTYYLFLILIRLEFSDYEIRNVLTIGMFVLDTGEAFGALAGLTLLYLTCALLAAHRTTMPKRLLF